MIPVKLFLTSGAAPYGVLVAFLAMTLLLGGCGLAQYTILSSVSTESEKYIPKNGSVEDILQAAAKHPEAALTSPAFYAVASPNDVAKALSQTDPTRITEKRVTDRLPAQGSFPSNFGSSLAQGTLTPAFTLETVSVDPMPVALHFSKYPEVISMLAEAGCHMQGRVRSYLDVWPPKTRNAPVDPEILAVLLRYEPEPENCGFLLTRLLFADDDFFPPEALKVFLAMAKNLDIRGDDRRFAVLAVRSGSLTRLRLLLAAGANPNYRYLDGDPSPLELARQMGRQDMVQALRTAGAR